MNNPYYWRVVGRWHVDEQIMKLKDTDELYEGELKNKKILLQQTFDREVIPDSNFSPISGEGSLYIPANTDSRYFSFAYQPQSSEWIRVASIFKCNWKEWSNWHMLRFMVRFMKAGEIVKEKMIRAPRFMENNSQRDLFIDVKVPDKEFDSVKIFYSNAQSSQPMLVDDLQVWAFDEKRR